MQFQPIVSITSDNPLCDNGQGDILPCAMGSCMSPKRTLPVSACVKLLMGDGTGFVAMYCAGNGELAPLSAIVSCSSINHRVAPTGATIDIYAPSIYCPSQLSRDQYPLITRSAFSIDGLQCTELLKSG